MRHPQDFFLVPNRRVNGWARRDAIGRNFANPWTLMPPIKAPAGVRGRSGPLAKDHLRPPWLASCVHCSSPCGPLIAVSLPCAIAPAQRRKRATSAMKAPWDDRCWRLEGKRRAGIRTFLAARRNSRKEVECATQPSGNGSDTRKCLTSDGLRYVAREDQGDWLKRTGSTARSNRDQD